jgi:hypothetical protein
VAVLIRGAAAGRFLVRDWINRSPHLAVEQSGEALTPTSYGCQSPEGPHARTGIPNQDALAALARSEGRAEEAEEREEHARPLRSVRGQPRTAPTPQDRRDERDQAPGASQRECGATASAQATAGRHHPRTSGARSQPTTPFARVAGFHRHGAHLRLVGPVPISLPSRPHSHDASAGSIGGDPCEPVTRRTFDPQRPVCPTHAGSAVRPHVRGGLQCRFDGTTVRCLGHPGAGHPGAKHPGPEHQGRVGGTRNARPTYAEERSRDHCHHASGLEQQALVGSRNHQVQEQCVGRVGRGERIVRRERSAGGPEPGSGFGIGLPSAGRPRWHGQGHGDLCPVGTSHQLGPGGRAVRGHSCGRVHRSAHAFGRRTALLGRSGHRYEIGSDPVVHRFN